jgi:hypothetical protein
MTRKNLSYHQLSLSQPQRMHSHASSCYNLLHNHSARDSARVTPNSFGTLLGSQALFYNALGARWATPGGSQSEPG